MKFTEEQIRKAIESAYQGTINPREDFTTRILEKLNEPEFDPHANQIVYNYSKGSFTRAVLCKRNDAIRPQTLDEHGPDVRAMQEALERIAANKVYPVDSLSDAANTLKKHRIPE